MTITLHLGVIDVPYKDEDKAALTPSQVRRNRRNEARSAWGAREWHGTTGDVAQVLEDKYHVMELFVEEVGHEHVVKAIEHSVNDAIMDMFSGAPQAYGPGLNPTLAATEEIQEAFRIFLDQRELDGVVPGVPTGAAKAGVNHRLKHPYAKDNPERSSFIDTGLYEASFRAWTD